MAGFGPNGFDANAPENNQQLIPKGDYPAVLVKSEVKQTANGKYEVLTVDFQILTGEYQNKHILDRFNFKPLSPTPPDNEKEAARIGAAKISELCRAVNVPTPKDSSELHGKPVVVKLGVQEAKGGYPARNSINGFKPRNFAAPVAAVAPQTPTPEPETANVGGEAQPW
jgi:hypothetical protein